MIVVIVCVVLEIRWNIFGSSIKWALRQEEKTGDDKKPNTSSFSDHEKQNATI